MKQTPHTAFDTLQANPTSKALKSTTKTLQCESLHKIPHKATLSLAFACAFSTAAVAQIAESSVDSSQSPSYQTPQHHKRQRLQRHPKSQRLHLFASAGFGQSFSHCQRI